MQRRFAGELILRMANHFICREQFDEEMREIVATCPGAFFGKIAPFSQARDDSWMPWIKKDLDNAE